MEHLEQNRARRQKMLELDRSDLERYQLESLNRLLATVLPQNPFYRQKFGTHALQLSSLSEWASMPMSQKSDWLGSDPSGVAVHHTFASEPYQSDSAYRRYHRTSGTRGRPMVILDTQQDWDWWIETWQYVLDACGIKPSDRILMAFSFGPFIGFWSAHDACLSRGCMVIPSGGMSTAARIDMILAAQPTVLFSTPSYAMHLAQDALDRGIDLSKSAIKKVFVAGEPGGSVPSIRDQIHRMYGAEVMDHAGATEIGPWGFGAKDGNALHVIESEFIAEFIPAAGRSHEDEGIFELVMTSLGRVGAPVLRYRTGDLVRPVQTDNPTCRFVRLEGGVLGRVDDMLVVRGVNVFPSSIDAILRSFSDVSDYRLTVTKTNALDELVLEFETASSVATDTERKAIANAISEKLSVQLNLRFQVTEVPQGALPRSDGKAKRIFDRRG